MTDFKLFHAAPRVGSADFAPEDPLAFDYLGQQIGNWLWPGFTSRTNRAGYYPLVTYGLKLCDELAAREGLGHDDATLKKLFERFERLWALAVCAYHGGRVPPENVMRGLRGALRYYAQLREPYTLDFELLSRQVELGGLGAYLTSLREHGLIARERLRPTPLGAELAGWMWDERGKGTDNAEAFMLAAVSPTAKTVPEKVGITTLRLVGEKGGLERIRRRPGLQKLVWQRLFEDHPPPRSLGHLKVMAECLVKADSAGARQAEPFLKGMVRRKWGRLEPELQGVASFAAAFGDLTASLRAAFDRTYRFVLRSGSTAPYEVAAAEAFTNDVLERTRARRTAWLEHEAELARMGQLSTHGPTFVQAMRSIDLSSAGAALDALLTFHWKVQKERGHQGGWLRREGDSMVLGRGGYASWSEDPDRWVLDFKTGAMRQLLSDLGRLS